MAGIDVETSRIRDVDRDSKILRGIPSKPYPMFDTFSSEANRDLDGLRHRLSYDHHQVGRDFPRTIKDGVATGCHHQSYSTRESNKRWFRSILPTYGGSPFIVDLWNWIDELEDYFDEMQPPERFKCKIASYTLLDEAERWWRQLEDHRISWWRMKHLVAERFIHTRGSMKGPSKIHSSISLIRECKRSLSYGLCQSTFISGMEGTTEAAIIEKQNNNNLDEGLVKEKSKENVVLKSAKCSKKCHTESFSGEHDVKEIHPSGFEHISPIHEETNPTDDEVNPKSHTITKMPSKEEAEATTVVEISLIKFDEMSELIPAKCSTKFPCELNINKQDETSDLEVLGELESSHERTDIGTPEKSKPSSLIIGGTIEHDQLRFSIHPSGLEALIPESLVNCLVGKPNLNICRTGSEADLDTKFCSEEGADDNQFREHLQALFIKKEGCVERYCRAVANPAKYMYDECMVSSPVAETAWRLFDPGGCHISTKYGNYLFPNYGVLMKIDVIHDRILLSIARLKGEGEADEPIAVVKKRMVFGISGFKVSVLVRGGTTVMTMGIDPSLNMVKWCFVVLACSKVASFKQSTKEGANGSSGSCKTKPSYIPKEILLITQGTLLVDSIQNSTAIAWAVYETLKDSAHKEFYDVGRLQFKIQTLMLFSATEYGKSIWVNFIMVEFPLRFNLDALMEYLVKVDKVNKIIFFFAEMDLLWRAILREIKFDIIEVDTIMVVESCLLTMISIHGINVDFIQSHYPDHVHNAYVGWCFRHGHIPTPSKMKCSEMDNGNPYDSRIPLVSLDDDGYIPYTLFNSYFLKYLLTKILLDYLLEDHFKVVPLLFCPGESKLLMGAASFLIPKSLSRCSLILDRARNVVGNDVESANDQSIVQKLLVVWFCDFPCTFIFKAGMNYTTCLAKMKATDALCGVGQHNAVHEILICTPCEEVVFVNEPWDYSFSISRGPAILLDEWNDAYRKFIMTMPSVSTITPWLNILWNTRHFKKTLRLFFKLVNGLDPPMK